MTSQPHDSIQFPLLVEQIGSVFDDVGYLAARHGGVSRGSSIRVPRYGIRPQAANVQVHAQSAIRRPIVDRTTGFSVPPHITVHADTVPTGQAPVAGHVLPPLRTDSPGWYFDAVSADILSLERSVYMTVKFTLTKPKMVDGKPSPFTEIEYVMNVDNCCRATWIFSNLIPVGQRPGGVIELGRPTKIYYAQNDKGRLCQQGSPSVDTKTYDINYADGNDISYVLHNDYLRLTTRVYDQSTDWVNIQFGAVTSASENYDRALYDGLLGLAPDSSAVYPHITFLNHLMIRRHLGFPEIGIFVAAPQLYPQEAGHTSYLFMGTPSNIPGIPLPIWKNVAIHGDWWHIKTPKRRVDNKYFYAKKNTFTVIDTGCSGIWLRKDVVDGIYAKIAGSEVHSMTGFYIFPKPNDFKSLPKIEIQMGDNGDYLELHPGVIIGHALKDMPGYVEGTVQSLKLVTRNKHEYEYLGLAAIQCMWLKFNYSTAQFKKGGAPYPPDTEQTSFSWAPKTMTG